MISDIFQQDIFYEGAQTRMDRERKLEVSGRFEVCKRLELRFPHRIIEESEIELCNLGVVQVKDGSLGSGKPNRLFIAKFSYQGNEYNLKTYDCGQFECDELKIGSYYQADKLRILKRKLKAQTGKKIDLKKVIIESYEEKVVWTKDSTMFNPKTETIYLFKVQFEDNTYEYCFDTIGRTRSFI